MSEEYPITRSQKNVSDNPGFSAALYIDVTQYENENRMRDLTDSLEAIRLGSSPTKTPRQNDVMKYYISSDLLKRLEENSPIKSQKSLDIRRKLSDICLQNCDKSPEVHEESLNEGNNNFVPMQINLFSNADKFNQDYREVPNQMKPTKKQSYGSNSETVISNVTNMCTRNFKLKSQVMPNMKEFNDPEESQENLQKMRMQQTVKYEEPESLFENMNFGNKTYFSPTYNTKQTKHTRKDSSPICTYYDGTTEYLSQTFYDEFKKASNEKIMSNHNFIKKVEPLYEEESAASNKSSNLYNTTLTDDHNSFNFPYMNFDTNQNNNSNNHKSYYMKMNNLGGNVDHQRMNAFNSNTEFAENINDDENYLESNISNIQSNLNQMNWCNNNMLSGYKMNVTPMKRGDLRNNTCPQGNVINNNNPVFSSISNPEDYTVEMFGRKGWICEMCNNFNYETRQKCNRCGVTKSPKRINKKRATFGCPDSKNFNSEFNNISMEGQDKKKKPFIERVGDWVCIKCKNLNFSFRVVCNRCQLPKAENEKMFDYYMNNLMKYVKYNEMMQQQILMNQGQTGQNGTNQTGFINNNSINMNNKFYQSSYQNGNLPNVNPNFLKQNTFNSGSNSYIYNSNAGNSVNSVGNYFGNNVMGNPFQISKVEEDEDYDEEQL